MKRRDFLSGLAVTSAALAAGQAPSAEAQSQNKEAQQNLKVPKIGSPRNIMISAANGITSRGNHL